ncbi:hypothetical protein TNCT_521301 [Trichonephila clavata]|uniref:Uncharacterized protein n=1 Tax=Trichonephila clavata TaxID=2740835 RepID=A0A8X6KBA2_TRICU|nr:hypothetical protein TNCT_521301 [Trichonephila clavata]
MRVCLVSLKKHFLQSRPLIPWLSLPTHNCGAMGLGCEFLTTAVYLSDCAGRRQGYWSYVEDNGGIEIRQVGKPVTIATAFRTAHAR